jgi:hypothetical protein
MSGGRSISAQPAFGVAACADEGGLRGARMNDDWPLHSYLELGTLPGAVPCARLHTRHVLWEWEFQS